MPPRSRIIPMNPAIIKKPRRIKVPPFISKPITSKKAQMRPAAANKFIFLLLLHPDQAYSSGNIYSDSSLFIKLFSSQTWLFRPSPVCSIYYMPYQKWGDSRFGFFKYIGTFYPDPRISIRQKPLN